MAWAARMALSLLEHIRFGYGPFGTDAPISGGIDADRLLAQLDGDDPSDALWARPGLGERHKLLVIALAQKKAGKVVPDGAAQQLKDIVQADQASFVGRPATTLLGFRERLVNLWANRLTVAAGPGERAILVQPYRDGAIRPHISGRYADLLAASLWHPAMQLYLDQVTSIGPNSRVGLRRQKGLNENLAREFLELHSMGSGYTQSDVTELARLLAGMVSDASGNSVDPRRVEPGEKHILGQTYGGKGADPQGEISRFVQDVAARPETAASTAHFIARHFIADDPPADLVTSLTAAYQTNDGALIPVYRALLTHPAAQGTARLKLRSPQEYVAATLRAAGLVGHEKGVPGIAKRGLRIPEAMARMGQPIYRPRRPDGWPEVASGWMTAPTLAARIDWATTLARAVSARADPVQLTTNLLGDLGTPLTQSAVRGAEQRWEGVAVLLASPDFMRR